MNCNVAGLENSGRRTDEESELGGSAPALALTRYADNLNRIQDWKRAEDNGRCVGVSGNADGAGTGVARGGGASVGVRRFQSADQERKQDAAHGDPAPHVARPELRVVAQNSNSARSTNLSTAASSLASGRIQQVKLPWAIPNAQSAGEPGAEAPEPCSIRVG